MRERRSVDPICHLICISSGLYAVAMKKFRRAEGSAHSAGRAIEISAAGGWCGDFIDRFPSPEKVIFLHNGIRINHKVLSH